METCNTGKYCIGYLSTYCNFFLSLNNTYFLAIGEGLASIMFVCTLPTHGKEKVALLAPIHWHLHYSPPTFSFVPVKCGNRVLTAAARINPREREREWG